MNSMPDEVRSRYDAIVVGARCAGAATAMLLARQGLDVLVLDRGEYGADTLSTHALMRGAVLQLKRWGVLDEVIAAGTPPVRRTSFHYEDETLEVPIRPGQDVDALYAPRRYLLDRVLVDAARRAGANVRFGCVVDGLIRSAGNRVTGVLARGCGGRIKAINADIVIGADGARSMVARSVGAETTAQARHATAVVYGYYDGIPDSGYHWYFGKGLAGGAIPTTDGGHCIFTGVPALRYREAFAGRLAAGHRAILGALSPDLAAAVAKGRLTEKLHGFTGLRGFMKKPFGPGWALVGDAGYFKDPITAHGITDALRDAELLARAVAHGSRHELEDYQDLRDALGLPLFRLTDAIAAGEGDMDALRRQHLSLNEAMKVEMELLSRLDARSLPRRRAGAAEEAAA